jgi:hypothetical protein
MRVARYRPSTTAMFSDSSSSYELEFEIGMLNLHSNS